MNEKYTSKVEKIIDNIIENQKTRLNELYEERKRILERKKAIKDESETKKKKIL